MISVRWPNAFHISMRFIVAGALMHVVVRHAQRKLQIRNDKADGTAHIMPQNAIFWMRLFFGRKRSRCVGSLASISIPAVLRGPLFAFFAWVFDANLEEVRFPLRSYQTFNEFFCRLLKEDARPISDVENGLVSPVDGRVLAAGVIRNANASIEQIKGSTFNVSSFLGCDPFDIEARNSTVNYIVFYLAPGNYHRFHAPCAVKFLRGQHFCGDLFPLNRIFLERVDDVFSVNERVVLSGTWKFGQMHLAAVGAANVGSIYFDFDESILTNMPVGDVTKKLWPDGVALKSGDLVGGFKLGSSVVLVFEVTEEGFKWAVNVGDAIRVGEIVGMI